MKTAETETVGRARVRDDWQPVHPALRPFGAARRSGSRSLYFSRLRSRRRRLQRNGAPLSGKSTVIGYPIFDDFNPNNYGNAYYLTVGLFPIAALLIFLGLTRIGPRVGLAVPPSRGRLRPLAAPAEAEPLLGPEPSCRSTGVSRREPASPSSEPSSDSRSGSHRTICGRASCSSTVGYSLLVVLGSIALGRVRVLRRPSRSG